MMQISAVTAIKEAMGGEGYKPVDTKTELMPLRKSLGAEGFRAFASECAAFIGKELEPEK